MSRTLRVRILVLSSFFSLLVFLLYSAFVTKWKSYASPTSEDARIDLNALVSYARSNNKEQDKAMEPPDFSSVKTLLLFIGYPRSGHTLVGCLLDAHPHVMLTNEYDLIYKWSTFSDWQKRKEFVFDELYRNAVGFDLKVRERSSHVELKDGQSSVSKAFNYSVPHQWNGRYDEYVQVIGDKKGGNTSRTFADVKSRDRLRDITTVVGVPVRFLHVIRNPFDNIATMAIRSEANRQFISDGKVLNNKQALTKNIIKYFIRVKVNRELRFTLNVLDVHSADMIKDPKSNLLRICKFLQIECDDKYLQDCASIVFKSPSKTRNNVVWTSDIKHQIYSEMRKYSFFDRYNFTSD